MPYTFPDETFLSQANAITRKHFDKTIKQVAYEDSVLFNKLKSKNKVKVKGGTQIAWPLRTEKLGTATSVDPRAAVSWATNDTRGGATLNWKFYYATTLIQWDELVKNRDSKEQIVNLLKDKVEELTEDMSDQMISDLYQTESSMDDTDIDCLDKVIGLTTYAGINPTSLSDPTRWKSQVDSTTTALSLYGQETGFSGNSLAAMINSATFGKNRPSLIITTQDIFDYIDYKGGEMVRVPDKKTLDLGFDNITFKGIPIVADPHCPTGYIFGIDEDQLELVVHPSYDMNTTDWAPHESYPNALFKGLSWAGNLKSRYRHTHFKMSAIASLASDG